MAATAITKTKLSFNEPVETTAAATLTADGATVDYDHDDQRILLLIGTADVTIKAGDGLQATEDLLVEFESGKTKAVVIESGKYKFHTGENKGKIFISGNGATVQAIQLP